MRAVLGQACLDLPQVVCNEVQRIAKELAVNTCAVFLIHGAERVGQVDQVAGSPSEWMFGRVDVRAGVCCGWEQ